MPATDYQGSSASFSHLGLSILSQGRNQVHSMEGSNNYHNDPATSLEVALEVFQRQVTDRFLDLSSAGHDDLLSLPWLRKLLDTFLFCQEEFRVVLSNHRAFVVRSPTNKVVSDYYERSLKALDVCNAIRDGIEQIRQWLKLLDIVLSALDNQKSIGEGQFRRAKRALVDLAIGMIDNKDSNAAIPHRNRSFGRNSGNREHHHTNHQYRSLDHFRSLSWSVSRTWSAAKQLQAIGNNLSPPRGTELVATNGLAAPVYTMNSILLFVMWALVAAIPCQDRGLQVHFSIPRQFTWAAPILSLHEKIMEESKKKDWKNACGLLKEIHQIEKFARVMNELADSVQFPLSEIKDREVREKVQELSQLCEVIKGGLDPLERQVREVFRRIVRSRTEGLDSLGRYLTSD